MLVNNAGGSFQAPFREVVAKGRDALMRENFTQVAEFVRARAAGDAGEGGSIVNVTSIEAHRAAPGYRGLRGHEGRGRESHQEPRARARRRVASA